MAYVPGPVPGVVSQLQGFLDRELSAVAAESLEPKPDLIWLKVQHVEPAKRADGLIALADGTNWNPGSGPGVYAYYGGIWSRLG